MEHAELFGELRDVLDRAPGQPTWEALVALVERVRAEGDLARFCDEGIPYTCEVLDRWPRQVRRVAPLAWINRLCFDGPGREEEEEDDDDEAYDIEDAYDEERYFPVEDEGVYGDRDAGDVPELQLANTLLLSDVWEMRQFDDYKPFDRRAFQFLLSCPWATRIHTLLHGEVVGENPYSAGPMIAPWFVGELLKAPAWRGLRTVRLGAFEGVELEALSVERLEALELVISPDGMLAELVDGVELLEALLRNPGAKGLRALGLGNMPWGELPLEEVLAALEGVREVRLIDLELFRLEEQGLEVEGLVRRMTEVEAGRPMRLVVAEYDETLDDVVGALDGLERGSWRVQVVPVEREAEDEEVDEEGWET